MEGGGTLDARTPAQTWRASPVTRAPLAKLRPGERPSLSSPPRSPSPSLPSSGSKHSKAKDRQSPSFVLSVSCGCRGPFVVRRAAHFFCQVQRSSLAPPCPSDSHIIVSLTGPLNGLVAKAVPHCFIFQLSSRPSPGAVDCFLSVHGAHSTPVLRKQGICFICPFTLFCLYVSRRLLAGLRPVLSTWVLFPPETVDSVHSFVGQLRCYSFARPSDGIEERVPQASVEPFRGESELDSLKTPGLESWEIETVIFTSYRWQLGSPY